MKQHIAHIALVVDDYDRAIEFYTQKLRFKLIEDTKLSDVKRWVLVAPNGSEECKLLLAKAATEEQATRIGNQTGGRVFCSCIRIILKEIIRTCWQMKLNLYALLPKKPMAL